MARALTGRSAAVLPESDGRPVPLPATTGIPALRSVDDPGQLPRLRQMLVVYYSHNDQTRYLAEQIAEQCGADLEEIVDRFGRRGLFGRLRSTVEALFGIPSLIRPSRCNPTDYEIVVIGTPIWVWNLSSPVRAYARRHRDRFRRVAFFGVRALTGPGGAFADLSELCGRSSRATLLLTERELVRRRHWAAVARFVRAVKAGRHAQSGSRLAA